MLLRNLKLSETPLTLAANNQAVEPSLFRRKMDEAAGAPRPVGVVAGAQPNIRQYLCQLSTAMQQMTRDETLRAVVAVTPQEVGRIGQLVARLRGRYLAQIVDLGAAGKPPPNDTEIAQLRRSRESHEEIRRGLDELRTAIEHGEIVLDGIAFE